MRATAWERIAVSRQREASDLRIELIAARQGSDSMTRRVGELEHLGGRIAELEAADKLRARIEAKGQEVMALTRRVRELEAQLGTEARLVAVGRRVVEAATLRKIRKAARST
jgi:hypothetical protein